MLAQPDFEIGDQKGAQFLADRPALRGARPIDCAFDVEQGVDAADGLQCQRRDHRRRFALDFAAGIRGDVGQGKERAPGMGPASRRDDRARFAVRVVQFVIAAEGVGLEDPGIVGEMCLRVLAAAIARVIKHRRRRTLSAKGPIVANIGP